MISRPETAIDTSTARHYTMIRPLVPAADIMNTKMPLLAAAFLLSLAGGVLADEFGEAAGWDISKAVDAPQRLLTDISLDGIRDICRELGIDWQRVIRGLSAVA